MYGSARKDGKEHRDVVRGSELAAAGGQWTKDFRDIARAYYNGTRPEIPEHCPKLLSRLMEACWQDKQEHWPKSRCPVCCGWLTLIRRTRSAGSRGQRRMQS